METIANKWIILTVIYLRRRVAAQKNLFYSQKSFLTQ